jgi:hypothetical protein
MMQKINSFLDVTSDFLAGRKGLIPLIGMILILINAVLQFYPGAGMLVETNLLLHLGTIIAILGFMLAWAL